VPNVPNSIEVWQKFRDQYSSAVIFGKTSVDDFLSKAATEVDGLAGQS
jgi:multiple sugar transport system substrate-binding protein